MAQCDCQGDALPSVGLCSRTVVSPGGAGVCELYQVMYSGLVVTHSDIAMGQNYENFVMHL